MKTPRILTTTIAALLLAPFAARAVIETWDGNLPNAGAGDSNISTGLNWADDTAPVSDLINTDLIFAGTTKLAPNFSAAFSTDSVTFNNTAGAFVLGGSALTIGATGIVNNDTQTQTFNNQVTIGTATSTFNAASGALAFSTLALGTNALTFNGALGANTITTITGSGSLTKSTGTLNYGAAGAVTQAWDLSLINSAAVSVNATTDLTVSTTGSITVASSTFTANGNVTMDATPFLLSGASSFFSVASGKTLTLQNGASLTSTGIGITHSTAGTVTATGSGTLVNAGANNLTVNTTNSTLNVLAGADATFLNLVAGSTGGTAIVVFDGAGTTATATGVGGATIGNGGVTNVFFSNTATGSFGSVNLATSASSTGQLFVLTGAAVTAASLLMVDDAVATETGSLFVNGAGSSFTIIGAGTAAIGAASLSTAALNVQNSGTFNSGTGNITLNATGGINITTGGIFNANGNLTLSGGDLSRDASGVLNIATGRTFTVQGASLATFTGTQSFSGANLTVSGPGSTLSTIGGAANLNINGGATVQVSAGHIDAGGSLNIGNTGPGIHTVTVDVGGSQLSGTGTSVWGALGGAANVTFGNSAVGSFGTLHLGNSATAGSAGTVLVQSGADVTSGQLLIANTAAATTAGSVTVTGAGSTWTISSANSLGIGAASDSNGVLNVLNGGVFNSGTGNSVIAATGTLAVNGGTFVANGGLTLVGGQFTRDAAGIFTLPASRALSIQSGGDAIFTGSYINSAASFISVSGAGSTFSTTSFLIFTGGSTVNATAGGAVSSGGTGLEFSGNGAGTVDGSGSTLTSTNLFVGTTGGPGSLTFSNGGAGGFAVIDLSDTLVGGCNGTLNIQSGSTVTGTGLTVGPSAQANAALVSITGAGSTLSLIGAATTALGATNTNTATLDVLNGGAFSSGTGEVTLNATGVINIDGGNANLRGPLVRNGGAINFTSGSLSIIDNWNVGVGGLLGTNVTFDATRVFTTTGTTSIDLFRTLTLNAGVLTTGALVNNGTFDFQKGTLIVTGIGGFNIGSGALGANVTLGPGTTFAVTNTVNVASGASLTVDGGSAILGVLNNAGLVEHVRGALSITGAATNLTGTDFFAAKPLSVGGVFTNQSGARLTLQNGTGRINGAGSVTNAGLLTGDGLIAVPVTNIGSGDIRAESGKTLYFTSTFSGNSGDFILQGGTLDFANAVTNNATGFISGRGALNTGGLTNNGVMAFSAGNTDLRGDTVNAAGARIVTSGAGSVTTFFDDVIHNGLEIFTGAGASTVFFGSQSGAGPFTGTGTVYFIGDLRPGNSPASVIYGGDVAFGGSSSLLLEIGGLNLGAEYDHLDVAGTLFADGDLTLALLDGYVPQFGDTFDLLDVGTFAGDFDTITAPALGGGNEWDFSALKTTGTVTVVPEPGIGALLLSALGLWLRRRTAAKTGTRFLKS